MSQEALTMTSMRVRAKVMASWERGLMYLARGQAAIVVLVFFPKMRATLFDGIMTAMRLFRIEDYMAGWIHVKPVGFHGDGGKGQGVREA